MDSGPSNWGGRARVKTAPSTLWMAGLYRRNPIRSKRLRYLPPSAKSVTPAIGGLRGASSARPEAATRYPIRRTSIRLACRSAFWGSFARPLPHSWLWFGGRVRSIVALSWPNSPVSAGGATRANPIANRAQTVTKPSPELTPSPGHSGHSPDLHPVTSS